jgi:F0F1-type ATP synthase membrane subunit b/b'
VTTVVNLNKARKARAKAEARAAAAENRLRHGRTKAERIVDDAAKAAASDRLDGHKREPE